MLQIFHGTKLSNFDKEMRFKGTVVKFSNDATIKKTKKIYDG